MLSLLVASSLLSQASAQVTATGPNGPTNPDRPSFAQVGTTVNQNSDARLISVNAIDDFCLFAPKDPNSEIGAHEHDVVAWCTKPRNNARIIPDGTIRSAQFLRTPSYVQVSGWWDGTKLNIANGDNGGELDPHGATGQGNPVGGNVTTNVATGSDVFYEVSRECTSVTAARQKVAREGSSPSLTHPSSSHMVPFPGSPPSLLAPTHHSKSQC
jgi:hypothetical protein